MPSLLSHSVSDKGLLRSNNEDSYLSEPQIGLWAVADGMGGHDAGEVASEIVKETLQRKVSQGCSLEDAIHSSHHAVLKAAINGRGSKGMGSTVVALLSRNSHYRVSWVGDSRAYLWTADEAGGRLEQLTTDHSYVQMLLATGVIDASEAEHHPDRHIITQCIGSPDNDNLHVDSIEGEWLQGQSILLCSDGLTDELDNQALAQIMCDSKGVEAVSNTLLQRALRSGGKDNITVQVIQSPLSNCSTKAVKKIQLPKITPHFWLDAGLYALALISILVVAIWTIL